MKHLVRICLAVLALLCAVPAVHADELCDAAMAEGKQKYNEGDYQTAQKLFEFAQNECGNDYKDAQAWIAKCNGVQMPTTLSVSKTSLQFGANSETKTITVTCNRTWSLANTKSDIFIVSCDGNKITVKCTANTSTSPRRDWFEVKSDDGKQNERITVSQQGRQVASSGSQLSTSVRDYSSTTGTENGHEWVDLGLSVKWATCNVGAYAPQAYGNYYAWGETETKTNYSWDTYTHGTSSDNLTKYTTNDGKTTLEAADDAAAVNWGGKWRMPTDAEWTELREKCNWTWTFRSGVAGYKVKSKANGNSIFLPAAGFRIYGGLDGAGYGYYWSSSLYTDVPDDAWYVFFDSGYVYRYGYYRSFGRSVRPVL